MKYEFNKYNFTSSELRSLELAAEGKTNKQIGKIMYISHHTVKSYLSTAMCKLKTHNRTNAVYLATKSKIIE